MKKGRLLQIVLIAMVIFMVVIPMFNKHYVRPRNFKKELYKKTRGNVIYESVKTEKINEFVDCVYESYKELHGHVDDFPKFGNMGKEDVKIVLKCSADYLCTNEEREYIIDHLDSLVTVYFNNK